MKMLVRIKEDFLEEDHMQEGQVRQDLYLRNLPTEGMTNNEIEALFVAFGPIAEVVRPVG